MNIFKKIQALSVKIKFIIILILAIVCCLILASPVIVTDLEYIRFFKRRDVASDNMKLEREIIVAGTRLYIRTTACSAPCDVERSVIQEKPIMAHFFLRKTLCHTPNANLTSLNFRIIDTREIECVYPDRVEKILLPY